MTSDPHLATMSAVAMAIWFTAISVLALLVGDARGPKWLPWIAKPCASLGFVALGWHMRPGDAASWTVFAALVLCLLGDLCLLSRAQHWFLAGLAAFFAGHVAYAAAFVQRGVWTTGAIAAALVLAIPAVIVWRWLRPHVDAPMRVPVQAYIVVITIMVACALAHGDPLARAAAIAFYFSDLSVARDVFVQRGFVNRLWGLPLYYAAQLGFAAWV